MADAPVPGRAKTAIPRNPGRHELGMSATLLFPDREIVERFYVPLVYTACRTCYSELAPEEIFRRAVDGEVNPAAMQRLITNVIESGHGSTIEHIVFTFAITGVSRTLSHQLVRHRAGVAFDQQSQRYVKFKGAATMLPATIADGDPELRGRYEEQVDGALSLYGELLGAGVPGEDVEPERARQVDDGGGGHGTDPGGHLGDDVVRGGDEQDVDPVGGVDRRAVTPPGAQRAIAPDSLEGCHQRPAGTARSEYTECGHETSFDVPAPEGCRSLQEIQELLLRHYPPRAPRRQRGPGRRRPPGPGPTPPTGPARTAAPATGGGEG